MSVWTRLSGRELFSENRRQVTDEGSSRGLGRKPWSAAAGEIRCLDWLGRETARHDSVARLGLDS